VTDSGSRTDSGPAEDVAAAKRAIRRRMRTVLAELEPRDRREASAAACRRLVELDAWRRASCVMLYLPLASEIDVLAAAVQAFRGDRTVCVPHVDWDRGDMAPVAVRSFDDAVLEADGTGVRTPVGGRPVVPDAIDLVVIPALAYDLAGHRLGRGGGYYDRFLPRLRRDAVRVGLVFDRQLVDAIPTEAHDVAAHVVVTERRLTPPATPPGPERPERPGSSDDRAG
jgi:5-formyltetrahydrofolate cyclo-ligase